jgi:hypothetical protein
MSEHPAFRSCNMCVVHASSILPGSMNMIFPLFLYLLAIKSPYDLGLTLAFLSGLEETVSSCPPYLLF